MRYRDYLRERYRALLSYAGLLTAIVGGLYLMPLLLLPFYPDEVRYAGSFLIAGLPLIVLGGAAWRWLRSPEAASLTIQESAVVVVLVWLIALFVGTEPFILDNNLTFTQAFFESTSGWTTTGLSVVNVEEAPRLTLFYRSFIQLAGGAGFAIIAVSAVTGMSGGGISAAEGRSDQLAPHVRRSSAIVLGLYSAYTISGVLGLRLAGMGWFDAVNHAFAAIAGGGFSTRAAGVAYWDNAAVEAVLMILMLLGATNFLVAYTFLRGQFRLALRSGEVRLMAGLIVGSVVLLLIVFAGALYPSFDKALRVALFETVSSISTTGFSSVTYANWPDFGVVVLTVLMLMGGGSGSTAGGMKLLRVYILYKAVEWEIRKAFMPPHMVNEPAIWQGNRRELLSDRQVRQTALFVTLYLLVFLLGSGLFMAYGYTMRDSFFEFGSALATTGLTIGVTRPDMPEVLLWAMSFAMLLGRLEFFTLIVGLLKLLNDSRTMLFSRDK